ncbi:cell division protein FtsQ/DivIB [Paralimibaculum aggregatum]|uniref:Cell division protein FtsQ n=1 Tax=Paralimibaculum aggregatum TaxID=3036245 RepID=A0ABQ6LP03_9RHOB|nr:cell division protein FtsQ/DivIB [Limibaculum sp. NKW23]GMG82349.1 cell division protein FtsQ/DivIB [Limibaculum sp. NKW23]
MRTVSERSAGPSRLAYRLRRAWAQAWLRNIALVYAPVTALALAGWAVVSTDRLRLAIEAEVAGVVERIVARPEFLVRGVAVEGAAPGLEAVLRAVVGPVRGQSSLRLDLDGLRQEIESLGEVASAALFYDGAGLLTIRVVERVPAALWRDPDGRLWVIDDTGVVISGAGPRASHPELPLMIGPGAPDRVAEIERLMAAAPDLMPRLRAFVRLGARRWDLVLDRGLTIKLPETGAERALAGAMALHFGEELFKRDLAVIDLRLPERPALRLAPRDEQEEMMRRQVDLVLGEDT